MVTKERAMSLLREAIEGYVFDSDCESFKEMIKLIGLTCAIFWN